MNKPVSVQHLVENEVMFRQYNEQVEQNMDSLRQMAKEDNQLDLVPKLNDALHFYCECSDEKCRERVRLSTERYSEIHETRDQFVVVCGHEINGIEHVLKHEGDYCIVKKSVDPPETASQLHSTPVHNV